VDEALYADLIAHARRATYRLAGLLDPEDVVHEAYLRVMHSERELSPALLHRAVNSVIADAVRRAKRRPAPLPLEDWIAEADDDVETRALTEIMAAEILRQLGDLAPTAVAIALGDSLNAVVRLERRSKATWWRRLRQLREAYR